MVEIVFRGNYPLSRRRARPKQRMLSYTPLRGMAGDSDCERRHWLTGVADRAVVSPAGKNLVFGPIPPRAFVPDEPLVGLQAPEAVPP